MSLWNPHARHHFLSATEFSRFSLAIFIMSFGEALISVFVPIFLYTTGYPLTRIFFFYLLVSAFFILVSFPGAKVVATIGRKHSILVSTPFLICYYLGFLFLQHQPWLFYFLPLLLAIHMALFNFGFHLVFLDISEKRKRGRQLAHVGTLVLLATAAAPFLGGLLAETAFYYLFATGALFMAAGTWPLFFSPDTKDRLTLTFSSICKKIFSSAGNTISFTGYAVESLIGRTVWPIFLFLILGTVQKTGILVSISMILSLLVFHFAGTISDRYDKMRLLKIGTVLYFFAWVGRMFADTAGRILVIDSYKNVSEKVLHIPWSAHSYDLAKKSDYFQFIVSREMTYNLARLVFIPLLMYLFWLDFLPFILSFILAGLASLGYLFLDGA